MKNLSVWLVSGFLILIAAGVMTAAPAAPRRDIEAICTAGDVTDTGWQCNVADTHDDEWSYGGGSGSAMASDDSHGIYAWISVNCSRYEWAGSYRTTVISRFNGQTYSVNLTVYSPGGGVALAGVTASIDADGKNKKWTPTTTPSQGCMVFYSGNGR